MKALFFLFGTLLITGLAISQTNSTVTLSIMGNRIKQVTVDNNYYTISNTGINEEQNIVINNLENGQHTLEIIRKNQYNNKPSGKISFTLRQGYDLKLSINTGGTVSSSEQQIVNGVGKIPVSTAVFNKLYTAAKKKTSSTLRAAYLENEFANTNKNFTSKQASTLIQLVNSESLRLKLAKLSYPNITDKESFSVITNLLNSPANRTDLNNYIASLPGDDTIEDDDATVYHPMNAAKFKIIYDEVNQETTSSDKNYYLLNFFSKDFNYYTSLQAKQLIQLINSEEERYNLAKTAYRGITDRENYGEVYKLLNRTADKEGLLAYIRTYNTENTRPGMSSADFNNLYQSVSYQNSTAARYDAINAAFTKPGNYFTVAQAKQLIQLINNESSRLLLSKAVYKILVTRSDYSQLNDLFAQQSSRSDFNNYVTNYENSYGNTGSIAMSDADYNQLYKSANDAWSATARYNLISDAFKKPQNYFTAYQVRQLLLLISSEPDRLYMAKNSYDKIVDQNNYSQLYDIFSTAASKNDLAQFVKDVQNGEGTAVKIPKSESEFTQVYKDIQFTFGIGAKMGALSAIFNNETNYFTVEQTKKLIEMVSSESNRLELAKSSYNNITDPANFTRLYDIFSSQASKDDLNAFVSSNAYSNR